MDIKITGHNYEYDVTSMIMLFFPGEKVTYVSRCKTELRARSFLKTENNRLFSVSDVFYKGKHFISTKTASIDSDSKNLVKQTLYLACSKATGIVSPWGILTGIRPMSVYLKNINNTQAIDSILKNEYFLFDQKIDILNNIYNIEKNIIESDKKDVSFYISIPFCPSKCSYCSFVSVAATKCQNELLSKYLDNLKEEIYSKTNIIKKYSLNVKTIYVGGGTPGILNESQLYDLLETINKNFDLNKIEEFSFELGRPETITKEKLELLKKYKVTRICINTQTTNNDVLQAVNRKHTNNDYIAAVNLAKSFSFRSINTDLIAGLPGESYESFCNSVNNVIETGIDNITIHTLAIKKSSQLSNSSNNYTPVNDKVSKMLEFSYNKLKECGYYPYYIYRQKNCISNGENIGYCKKTSPCLYNVYMMEDVHSILSCGAGASTKFINSTKTDRVINVKYPMEYVNEYEKILSNIQKTDNKLKEIFENGN